MRVSARIGFARFPADGAEPQALLQNAEVALCRARYGGEGVVLYSPRLSLDAAARLALEAQLRQSVEQEAFELQYQPIISAASGRITAVDALLRWRHPEHGLVSAGRIVPLLESLGLIEKVGAWALRRAAGDRAARLDLEVTESMLMHDAEASTQKLNQLRSFGVHIVIDDFGTGYSSLSRLASLPITTLKIDRSFVQDIESDRRCVAVVETILSLARAAGTAARALPSSRNADSRARPPGRVRYAASCRSCDSTRFP